MTFLNVDKAVEKALGLDEFGIGRLRSIEWSRKYLWSIGFIDIAPQNELSGSSSPIGPYSPSERGEVGFFPCVDVDETQATLQTLSADVYGTTLRVPQRGELTTLKVTFIDDAENTLFKFFRDWIALDILNGGEYVSPIEECVKAIELRKMKYASIADYGATIGAAIGVNDGADSNPITEVTRYWVFPEGSITYNGGSTSDVNTYSIDLVAAGEFNTLSADNGLGDTLGNIARSFGAGALTGGIGTLF